MAKNWTMAEAATAVKTNDMEAIADLGKRFPLAMHMLEKGIAGDGEAVAELFSIIPEFLTVNKVEKAIKSAIGEDEENEENSEETEAEVKEKKTSKAKKEKEEVEEGEPDPAEEEDEAEADNDYESKTSNELYKILSKRGLTKGRKFSKKADMIAALKADDAKGDTDAEDEVEEAEETDEYSGMTVQELYKECKKRGIKAAIKKPAKYYIDLLKKYDAECEAEADDNDDDWGDEEETVEEKSKKPASKKKPAKKAEEEDEDDDDDWDI